MKKRLKNKLHNKNDSNRSAETEGEKTPAAQMPAINIAEKIRADFHNLLTDLRTVIDGFDDEELLRQGKDSAPYQNVVKLVEIRDRIFALKNEIPDSDDPDRLIADFNRAIEEMWQKLDAKWKNAEQRFPELAESLRGELGNIVIESDRSPFQTELESLKEGMDKLLEFRPKIYEALEADPNDRQALDTLAQLESALETGKRQLSKLSAQTFRQQIVNIFERLNDEIENTADEEIIESIADTAAARLIRDYADVLANFEPAMNHLHPDDKPEEILAIFNRTIVEARRKLKERRAAAERRNPRLKKEFPMSESYNKALADLLEVIKTRDEMAETLKLAPPEKRAEGLRLLQMLDKKIEDSEQILAEEYEAFQNHARAVDALRDEVKLASAEELKHLRRFLKENPEEMPDLQKLLAEEFPE